MLVAPSLLLFLLALTSLRAQVHVFGSQATDMYLPQSDIDLVVLYRRTMNIWDLASAIERSGAALTVQVIDKARVPIIKLVESRFNIHVDISFNAITGPRAAEELLECVGGDACGRLVTIAALAPAQLSRAVSRGADPHLRGQAVPEQPRSRRGLPGRPRLLLGGAHGRELSAGAHREARWCLPWRSRREHRMSARCRVFLFAVAVVCGLVRDMAPLSVLVCDLLRRAFAVTCRLLMLPH